MWVHYSIKRSFNAGLKVDAFPADEVKMGLSLYRDGGPKKIGWGNPPNLIKPSIFAHFKMLEVISETPLN